jgi:hypothetical protein
MINHVVVLIQTCLLHGFPATSRSKMQRSVLPLFSVAEKEKSFFLPSPFFIR